MTTSNSNLTLNGNSGSNTLTGGAGNDQINGRGGDDVLSGGAGNDEINGGAGNDILDGGSGSDELEGGSGNDTLIYKLAENNVKGTHDEYDGGSGTDTLELQFTRAEWMNASNQTVLQSYLNWASKSGSNCHWDDEFTFKFANAKLEIEDIEKLVVKVDNKVINNAGNNTVDAVNDNPKSITEDEPGVQKIDVLSNDSVDDLVKELKLDTGPAHGTVALIKPILPNGSVDENANNWYFNYTPDTNYYQKLNVGDTATESFTYTVTDANGDNDTATVNITITGLNDAAIIGDPPINHVKEDTNVTSSDEFSLFANLPIIDVDNITLRPFISGSIPSPTDIGRLFFPSTGQYIYAIDNSKIQFLGEGKEHTDYFTVTSIDGTSKTISFIITGVNDKAVIGDPSNNQITEDKDVGTDGYITLTGNISISDVDEGENSFQTKYDSLTTKKGSFTIAEDGSYTYKVNNADLQSLNTGDPLVDKFTIYAKDGTSKDIIFSIKGINDAATIGGDTTGEVTESGSSNNGGTPTVTGQLTATDVDSTPNTFIAVENQPSTYGKFSITSGGLWTYTLDNINTYVEERSSTSELLPDSFKIHSIDGTEQTISINIKGADDVVSKLAVEEIAHGTTKYAGSANVTELINLDHFAPNHSVNTDDIKYKAKYDFDHVRTGKFTFNYLDGSGDFTIKVDNPDETIGKLKTEFSQSKDSNGQTINGKYDVNWTYTVKDSELDPLNTPEEGKSSKDQKFKLTISDGTDSVDTDVVLHLFGRNEIKFSDIDAENNVDIGTDGTDIKLLIPGNDVLYLGLGNDSAKAENGNDVIYGEDGNDNLSCDVNNSVFFGGSGDDNIVTFKNFNNGLIFGESGNDNFTINNAAFTPDNQNIYIWGGEGSDAYKCDRITTPKINVWAMDFDSLGGDTIFCTEQAPGKVIHHDWINDVNNTQLVTQHADSSNPFLSEGAEYYELQVKSNVNSTDPNWYTVLNLVGNNITLDGLIANHNLV